MQDGFAREPLSDCVEGRWEDILKDDRPIANLWQLGFGSFGTEDAFELVLSDVNDSAATERCINLVGFLGTIGVSITVPNRDRRARSGLLEDERDSDLVGAIVLHLHVVAACCLRSACATQIQTLRLVPIFQDVTQVIFWISSGCSDAVLRMTKG